MLSTTSHIPRCVRASAAGRGGRSAHACRPQDTRVRCFCPHVYRSTEERRAGGSWHKRDLVSIYAQRALSGILSTALLLGIPRSCSQEARGDRRQRTELWERARPRQSPGHLTCSIPARALPALHSQMRNVIRLILS
ncbi:hypothetical protein NDU88_003160 [Pleurodeles waltl]|uniref:Uncharacterized protein n=1 Tax=Pleurodeles waltl TaxID=8319 RepID=A0AAV7WSA5_PLEWA|nr:hypothetical protein NDU88_003160 [Pleurodeles waltl]